MTCNVAFIGLGVMGYPMAGYISKAGHSVTVYNRTKSKAEKWTKEYKGKIADTPAEAAKDSEFVFLWNAIELALHQNIWCNEMSITSKDSKSEPGRYTNSFVY